MEIRRLTPKDRELARRTFGLMADVFEEEREPLSDRYLDQLLGRDEFWALAAVLGTEVVGGLTAHTLPMTRSEAMELLIYDIAVHADYQRQGIGRSLLNAIREQGAAAGIAVVFVLADNEDAHAIDFYRSLGGDSANLTAFTFQK